MSFEPFPPDDPGAVQSYLSSALTASLNATQGQEDDWDIFSRLSPRGQGELDDLETLFMKLTQGKLA